MRRLKDSDFDVIVLGSGLSGCFVASILARHGHSVLIIDKGVHPRFTIGESTIPQTSQQVQLVSRKYDVPELAALGLRSPTGLREEVSCNSGVKQVVGFAYHELGEEHRPEHEHHFGNTWRTENHLFRQDVDAWLMTVAIGYGCHILQGTGVASVDIGDDRATIVTDRGDTFTSRFVVDGSGARSVLADKLDLREKPCGLKHRSRGMFTHVVGLKDFEDVVPSHMSHSFSKGTLHHVFKRGWFWVIPFNNWEGATNPLVSVGLCLDDRFHPEDPELGPEEEFVKFLEMVPAVERQFADAQVIRPWVRSKRMQYSSARRVGKRFALLAHTAGFADPLYSRGLISTFESVDAICEILLEALKDDDFTEDRFEPVQRQGERVLHFADRLVHGSYLSWDDFDMWDVWVRLWAIGTHVVESHLGSVLAVGKASWVEEVVDPVFSIYEDYGYKKYFTDSYAVMTRYEAGEITSQQAARELEALLAAYEFKMPLLGQVEGQEWAMKNPGVRDIYLGIPERHERWAKHQIDDHLVPSG